MSIALANWAAKTRGGSGGVIDLRDPARRDKLLIITGMVKVRGRPAVDGSVGTPRYQDDLGPRAV